MPSQRPLLARDDSQDSLHAADEEDALLTGQPTNKDAERWRKYREAGLSVYSIVTTIAVIVLAILFANALKREQPSDEDADNGWDGHGKPTGKRNLIFMVSDGMGPTSLSMTRSFRQYVEDLPIDDVLVLDEHLIGSSRTRSSSSLITDSAAGATAFSCGFKSYNGAISVLPDHTPCGTVLEAAKKAGYMTGLVVTTRLTDATPACFAAHANSRAYEDLIAEQMVGNNPLGRVVDVMIGGGRCHFLPNTTDSSCRVDDKDVVKMAREKYGWNYVSTREQFNKLDAMDAGSVQLPLLALMADLDIPYEIDRCHIPDEYPSQSEMASLALRLLSAATADSDKGFFLMIEGSRVDHAGHGNDPAAQVHEVLEHDKSFATVLDFLEDNDTPGVLISTSDHETGGLAAGRQVGPAYPVYRWYPQILANASHSASHLGHRYLSWLSTQSHAGLSPTKTQQYHYIRAMLEDDFGIFDADPEEIENVIEYDFFQPPSYIFADIISSRADIGWSTHGHTAVDVNIYASDPKHALPLVGNHENIEVGKFLANFLEVDVDEVTKELRKKRVKTGPKHGSEELVAAKEHEWMGPIVLPTKATLDHEKDEAVFDEYTLPHDDVLENEVQRVASDGAWAWI